jgi:hypothetical protein
MERVNAMTYAKFVQVGDLVMYAHALWNVLANDANNMVTLRHSVYGTTLVISGEVQVFKV